MNIKKATPVIVFFFKRRHVLQVIEKIKAHQPQKLYLVADGGRNEAEHQQCLMIRQEVDAMIDWHCDVVRLYQLSNLGVDVIIPTTITEVFKQEEQLIVLEDDCVPDVSFFDYCEVLLDKYKSNKRIMSISGVNWFDDVRFSDKSYFFSIHNGGPGFATWRDAWQLYNHQMSGFDDKNYDFISRNISQKYMSILYLILFRKHYLPILNKQISPWDGKWLYAFFSNQGLSIMPSKNLISNIGFDQTATHTTKNYSPLANKKRYKMELPLKDENNIIANTLYDELQAKKIHNFTYLKFFKTKLKVMLGLGNAYKV